MICRLTARLTILFVLTLAPACSAGAQPDGGLRWRFRADGALTEAATIADGTLYFTGSEGILYAVDARTGQERWRFRTAARGYISTPTIFDGTVYFGSGDAHLYAVNARTGRERWRFRTGDFVFGTPAVADGIIYFSSGDEHLYAVDVATRAERWKIRMRGRIRTAPVVVGETVYFGAGTGIGEHYVLAVESRTGRERWRHRSEYGEIGDSLAVGDGTVYFTTFSGPLFAVEARTGRELWRNEPSVAFVERRRSDGTTVRVSTSLRAPTLGDDLLYCTSDDGVVYAFDRRTGGERWRFQTGDAVYAAPLVADGTLYFGARGSDLYALDAARGEVLWRLRAGVHIRRSLVAGGGTLYFGSNDGHLYAVDIEAARRLALANRPLDVPPGERPPENNSSRSVMAPSLPPVTLTVPAVSGDVLYVVSNKDRFASDGVEEAYLYAFNRRSGAMLFRRHLTSNNLSSPTASGNSIYFGGKDGYLYAIDARTGQDRWRFQTNRAANAPTLSDLLYNRQTRSQTGGTVSAPPVVAGDTVFAKTVDGTLYAVNRVTGRQTWSRSIGAEYRPPTDYAPAADDRMVYVGGAGNKLYAMNAETGAIVWQFQTGGRVTTPTVAAGTVYFGSDDGNLYAVDAATGRERWRFNAEARAGFAPIVQGDTIYFQSNSPEGSSYLHAVDAATGRLRWEFRSRHVYDHPPVIAGEAIYAGNANLEPYFYALDARSGQVRQQIDTARAARPVGATNDAIYLFGGADLLAIDSRTHRELWRFSHDAERHN